MLMQLQQNHLHEMWLAGKASVHMGAAVHGGPSSPKVPAVPPQPAAPGKCVCRSTAGFVRHIPGLVACPEMLLLSLSRV